MFKNKNINFIRENEENELLALPKYCEWKGCEQKGLYRAPSSRENLREFKWFCLKHVKLYNKGWDYFKGKSSEEIYSEISEDATWHRKTSKIVKKMQYSDDFLFFNHDCDNFKNKSKKENIQFLQESLRILNMEMPENLEVLKKQYKLMAKRYHPDLNKLGGKEKIIELNEAYSFLLKFFRLKRSKW